MSIYNFIYSTVLFFTLHFRVVPVVELYIYMLEYVHALLLVRSSDTHVHTDSFFGFKKSQLYIYAYIAA